jgi:capsular exopolysaccharide synthesis family protein
MQAGQEMQNFPMNGQRRLDETAVMGDSGGESTEGKPKGGFKIRPILATVRRNIPIILGVTAIAGGLSFLVYRSTPLIYEGDFTILVEPISSQARATDPTAISRASQFTGQDNSTVDYPTLLQVLQSPELLSKISAQIQTRYPEITASALARALKNQDFTVARIGTNLLDSTRTLEVTFRGTNAQQVQFVLDKLAEGYLRFSLEDRKTRIGGGVEFIEDQLPGLQQRVNNLESQIQSIRQRYRFTDPEIENQQVVDQLKEVQKEKLMAETALQEQATLYRSLQSQLDLSPEQGLAASSLSQNTRFQDLLNQRQKVQSQIATSLARFTEDSPTVQRLRGQEQNLNRLISQEAGSILGRSSPGVPGNTQVVSFQDPLRISMIGQLVTSANQTRALQARRAQILQTESALNQRLIELPAIVRQYNTLQQQLDIATKTLNQFLLQRETLRVEAAQKEVPWEIIAKPKLVSSPLTGKPMASRGKKATQMLMAGVVGGLFLGVLAALLREKMRNVFVTAEDLQDAIQHPFLGNIPSAATLSPIANGKFGKQSNPFLDAFSSLYTNLRFLHSSEAVKSVVVSSVEAGDGKTIVALNLAQMAASMGQRVLLVDANFLAPQLHTLMDVSNQRGLVDVLQQKQTVEQVIHKSSLDHNLFVLPAGPVQAGSTKLFAATEMHKLAQQLRTMFDLVIFDSPSLEGLTDLNFLAAQTDGFLMVAGVNKTKRSRFNQALAGLKTYRLPVVGVVANRSSAKQSSYPVVQQSGTAGEMPSAFFGNLKESADVSR